MHSNDVLELSNRRLVLTLTDTMKTLAMSEEAATAAIDAAHAAFPKETQLLYAVLTEHKGSVTTTLCIGPEEADKLLSEATANICGTAHKHLYGLQRLSACLNGASSPVAQPAPRFRPGFTPQLRAYPLATREAVERGESVRTPTPAATPAQATAKVEAAPVKAETTTTTTAVKQEASPSTSTPNTTAGKQAAAAPAMPFFPVKKEPVTVDEEEVEDVPREIPAAAEKPKQAVTPPVAVVVNDPVAEPAPASPAAPVPAPAPVPAQRQASLFDMMKGAKPAKTAATTATAATTEAGATKRARTSSPSKASGTTAPAAKKKKSEAAPKKAAAAAPPTRSLAKLAKASAKTTSNAAGTQPKAQAFDFDEEATDSESDDDETVNHNDGFLSNDVFNEAAENEEVAALDVAVTAVNDEIILCDDSAPMAFREPVKLAVGGESTGGSGGATTSRKADTSSAHTQQRRLSTFFNADVVALQNQYTKELQTDMRLEDGEYVCVDVICYRNKKTNEVISESEFHQRSAEVAARQADENTPTKEAGVEGSSPASTSSAATSNTRTHKMKVSKLASEAEDQEETAPKPAPRAEKNLLSFFKQ